MSSIYDGGVEVDRRVRQYQAKHPGTSYSAALRALMKQEDEREDELREEFNRRVPAYQSEFQKSYSDAARMVAGHDNDMIEVYGYGDADAPSLAKRQGEIWREAKERTNNGNMKMSDAVLQLLQNDREVSRKIAGDWLDATARTAINNLNLGSDIQEAFPKALRATMAAYPEVRQQYETGAATTLSMRTIFNQWF